MARRPRRRRECPGGHLHHDQHRRRSRPSAPRPTPTRRKTAVNAITGHDRGPRARCPTTSRRATTRRTPPSATATRWAWPSTKARSTRSGPATSTRARTSRQQRRSRALAADLLPADGHRRRAADHHEHHGADPNYYDNRTVRRAARSASPSPSTGRSIRALTGYAPTFTPADVLVYYHDTTNGDPSVPLQVLSVTPVPSSGVGPDSKFGYTEFTVTFDPTTRPDDSPSDITNYTGTYSYMILPRRQRHGDQLEPIRSFVNSR